MLRIGLLHQPRHWRGGDAGLHLPHSRPRNTTPQPVSDTLLEHRLARLGSPERCPDDISHGNYAWRRLVPLGSCQGHHSLCAGFSVLLFILHRAMALPMHLARQPHFSSHVPEIRQAGHLIRAYW